jgi:hypothetical protein
LLAPTIGGVPVLTDSSLPDGVVVIHNRSNT